MAGRASADMPSNIPPETYLFHRKEIAEHRRVMEESRSLYRLALKRAKKAGVDTDAMLELIEIQKKDPHEVEHRWRKMAEYAKWEGRPLGFQRDMFSADDSQDLTSKQTAEIDRLRIEEDGYTAAIHGAAAQANGYPAGSEEAVIWVSGWSKGADFLKRSMELKGDDEPTDAQPRKRGRPRANTESVQPIN